MNMYIYIYIYNIYIYTYIYIYVVKIVLCHTVIFHKDLIIVFFKGKYYAIVLSQKKKCKVYRFM